MLKYILLILFFFIQCIFSLSAGEHEVFIIGNRLFKPLSGRTILEPVNYIFADTDNYFTGGFGLSLSFYQYTGLETPQYNSQYGGMLFPNSMDSVFKLQCGIYIADALSLFLDKDGFLLDSVDFIYGTFIDFKYRFITASIQVKHHCGNRSTGTINDPEKIEDLYIDFYSLESLIFYIDADIFKFRPYFGASFGKNLYGGGSETTDPNNVINFGVEYHQDLNNVEWLEVFSALDFFIVSMNGFSPNTGITAGVQLKSIRLFIRYYDGINLRGIFYGNEEKVFSGGIYTYF